MRAFFLRRIFYSAITLVILATTIFVLVRLTGDPVFLLAPDGATEEELQVIREQIGTDKSIPAQFVSYLSNLARGDFGTSFQTGQSVRGLYLDRLPNSLLLVSAALAFALTIGIPAGIISAVYSGRWMDTVSKVVALTGMAVPGFILAFAMMFIFAVKLRWLPVFGIGSWKHLVMPAIAVGWYFAASTLRLVRSSMLEILDSDYVKLARLKGMTERKVVLKHAFKNALIPLITLTGVNFVVMINVATVVELVFTWPGLGSLLIEAIRNRDFPLVQGVTIMAGIMIVFANFAIDMIYAWIDPRIRLNR
ncbi:MAG: ABC transporter permease [Actinomycetia bacterium]|nr:ABC transporter permease [Actinomycetes bacterium]MCP5035087.1 ABC transporter permease [Actinomycetes bacterium]